MRPDHSLDARYFDDVFASDDDPWSLASSEYEAAKFDDSIAAIDDRRYAACLEIGCAHGVFTHRLGAICDAVVAIDISQRAVNLARTRTAACANILVDRRAFPADSPSGKFDLIALSEVVYYWDDHDIARAAEAIHKAAAPGCRLLLVHWIGETDYPQTGDEAVNKLQAAMRSVTVERADRNAQYRLDVWRLA